MKPPRIVIGCYFAAILAVGSPGRVNGQVLQEIPEGRDSLRGLSWISHVFVSPLNEEVERDGLTVSNIRTDVELRLRQSRIPLTAPSLNSESDSGAYLDVAVNLFKHQTGLYAVHSRVSLRQKARLTGKIGVSSLQVEGAMLFVPTWETENVGTVGSRQLRSVRDNIKDQVDLFINDWLAVH